MYQDENLRSSSITLITSRNHQLTVITVNANSKNLQKSDLVGLMLLRQGHIVFFKVNSVKSCFGLEKRSELY